MRCTLLRLTLQGLPDHDRSSFFFTEEGGEIPPLKSVQDPKYFVVKRAATNEDTPKQSARACGNALLFRKPCWLQAIAQEAAGESKGGVTLYLCSSRFSSGFCACFFMLSLVNELHASHVYIYCSSCGIHDNVSGAHTARTASNAEPKQKMWFILPFWIPL